MNTFDYYASLARRLSPAELARAAVRRAYRSTRRKLFQIDDPGRREAILQAFFAESAEDLCERALGPRPVAAWCDVRRKMGVRAALDRVPSARHRVLERARRYAEGRFPLFGRVHDFGRDASAIDWSLDVVSGHRYPLVAADAVPLFQNGADPKFPWSVGRLDSLVALGQGAWAAESSTEADAFARAFVAQLQSFMRQCPPGLGVQWTCTMDVALRAANLAQGLLLLGDSQALRQPGVLLDALEYLMAHAQFVEAHLEDASAVPNNHLVADLVGLLVVGLCFPELPGSTRWIALAVTGLREQMLAQVHPDGWTFEGSIPYHRLSTELFTLAHVFAEEAGATLGSSYSTRLRSMYRVCRDFTSEAGRAPQLGDNDSGHAFALAERGGTDFGYLAPLGAALFDAAELKSAGSMLPDEGVWLLGLDGLQRFQRLEPRAQKRSRISEYSGIHLVRGGNFLLGVSAGLNGQKGAGGHNHNDKLSFELHIGGQPVIVDPGSPTYGRNPAERNRFRSTAMHNTPEVDGREQNRIDPSRLFALEDAAKSRVQEWEQRSPSDSDVPTLQRLVAVHEAYAPVTVRRTFELWTDGSDVNEAKGAATPALLVADEILGQGEHAVVFRFHLPDTEARLRSPTEAEKARATALSGGVANWEQAVELGPEASPRAVLLVESGTPVELDSSDYSAGYGEKQAALCVTARLKARELPLTRRWIVFGVGRES